MSYLGRSAKLSLKAQEKVSFLATAGQTSKTGLSYTPSFIEVYVNGVLLTDTTDFTATNGNSVTFTVALLLNDEVTVISLKTFTVADHYTKSDADTLLAAKATNTAVALKAPIASPSFTGNVVTQGVNPTITIQDSDEAGDGFIKFKTANGTQRGYIQTAMTSDVMIFGTGTTERMRLISSGGLTFNGDTAAANALDDYEEGNWTASLVNGTNNPVGTSITTVTYASYTKIGRQVNVYLYCDGMNFNSSSATFQIAGLPFAPKPNQYGGGSIGYTHNFNVATKHFMVLVNPNGSLYFHRGDGNSNAATNADLAGCSYMLLSANYITDV
jgi:hypothetical protein